MRPWLLLLLLLGSVGAPRPGHAQHQLVTIAVEDASCAVIDGDRLQRLLDLELGTSTQAQAIEPIAPTRVTITCGQLGGLVMTVVDPVTRKSMRREVTFQATSSGDLERLLALSVTEFVHASWLELEMAASGKGLLPIEPSPPATAVAAVRERLGRVERTGADARPASEEPATIHIGAALGVMHVARTTGPTWLGGRLLLGLNLTEALSLELAGSAMFGDQRAPSGFIDSDLLGARLTAFYEVSLAGPIWLSLGVGGQADRLAYSGTPLASDADVRGEHGSALVAGPLFTLRTWLRATNAGDIGLRVDTGLILTPLQLEDQQQALVMDASGLWLCVSLDLRASM